MRPEGFYVNESPLTLVEIEPATFRFVAEYLKQCATAVSTGHIIEGIKFVVLL